ncbi:MAG: acetylxylan esterase [Abditibacteriales bacterium]|nr:acetylxylan esterase [Abditibacteriales bacterium]MDW8366639.1 hypothetical protein [Abditibacteriales bacterium]
MPTEDRRFADVRDLNKVYTFTPRYFREAWLRRAAALRQQILVSTGLYPMPEKTPLNAKVFGKIEREDYTVEKVYFESYPGFFVTGNLYRPKGKRGPFPGILNPHGHWGNGRFANEPLGSIAARCITQARLGWVAFSWDMVGYNDSLQVPHNFAHPNTPEGKRLTLWGISLMGLQTWNSIRAIDFLQSLPDVDPTRIACTGESGGGTQTFMVCAVDERIQLAAPVNMISAHMQGGCLCENAPGLRLDTNNVEIAALFAPKPMLMVSCTGDWTVNTPKVEYPAVRSIYELFGAADKVQYVYINAGHNYNQPSREAVYGFFAHYLQGRPDTQPIPEPPYVMEKIEDLRVFPDKKLPPNAVDATTLTKYLIEQSEKQLEDRKPKSRTSLNSFREVYAPALRHALGVEVPSAGEVVIYNPRPSLGENYTTERFFIGRADKGDLIPAVLFAPPLALPLSKGERVGVTLPLSKGEMVGVTLPLAKEEIGGGRAGVRRKSPATLVVHARGKAALLDMNGAPNGLLKGLLRQGHIVLAIDCFGTGESQGQRKEVNFFATYNRTDLAERVQDILTALVYLKNRFDVSERRVNLIGLDKAGLWCLLARGLMPDVARAVIDAAQFDSTSDEAFVQDLYAPSLRRAGDVRTAAALAAPRPLFLHNTGSAFRTQWIADVYRAVRSEKNLRIERNEAGERKILRWLGE